MLRSTTHRTAVAGRATLALAMAMAIGLAFAPAQTVRGATHEVSIGDGFFGPDAITVAVGDTVTWTNDDDSPHTVTADGGAFDSGNLDPGQNFSFTFTEPGTFAYVCNYHDDMVGTITVVAGAPAQTPSPSPAADAAATGTGHAGGHAADQPDTALPATAAAMPPIAALLIGIGLVALAFGLFPPRSMAVKRTAARRGGWSR